MDYAILIKVILRLKPILFFHRLFCIAPWNPTNPLIDSPADCPIAYRICDVAQTYNFQLVDAGTIDDAHGSLVISGLNQSSPTQFDSKSAWILFTPQYSGEFGFSICPETVEVLSFLLLQNPDCSVVEPVIPFAKHAEPESALPLEIKSVPEKIEETEIPTAAKVAAGKPSDPILDLRD
mgnify:CR=1 FL=1